MSEIVPYFAGLITLIFGIAFALAIKRPNDKQ